MGGEIDHTKRGAHILRSLGIEVESEEDSVVTIEWVGGELDVLEVALYLLGTRERDSDLFCVELTGDSGGDALFLRADRVENRYIIFQKEAESPNSVCIEAYSNRDFPEETTFELTRDSCLWHINITRSRIFQVLFQKIQIKSLELCMRIVMIELEGGYLITICDNGLQEFHDDEDYDYDDDYDEDEGDDC